MKTKIGHKLGANRKESAMHPKKRKGPAESQDVREDRTMRQEKFSHRELY